MISEQAWRGKGFKPSRQWLQVSRVPQNLELSRNADATWPSVKVKRTWRANYLKNQVVARFKRRLTKPCSLTNNFRVSALNTRTSNNDNKF